MSEDWTINYFNYFTEIEERFQRARGTALFLLSPLDWALIESWKNAGVPLEAVMRGIDSAFEKWRARKVKTQMVNSLAFCAQAVLTEARNMAGAGRDAQRRDAPPPFELTDLRRHLESNAAALPPGCEEIAAARSRRSDEELLEARRELDRELRPYRSKMTADQLAMLERQYLDRRLLEKAGLPRLSLFYLR